MITTLANNQVVVEEDGVFTFYSYGHAVARRGGHPWLLLNGDALDGFRRSGKSPLNFSSTTNKYILRFFGMDRKELEKNIASGDIKIMEKI